MQNIATGLIKANRGGELIGALLVHLAYEYGPCYARDLWRRSDCRWQQFVQDDVKEFIQQYVSHDSTRRLPTDTTIQPDVNFLCFPSAPNRIYISLKIQKNLYHQRKRSYRVTSWKRDCENWCGEITLPKKSVNTLRFVLVGFRFNSQQ